MTTVYMPDMGRPEALCGYDGGWIGACPPLKVEADKMPGDMDLLRRPRWRVWDAMYARMPEPLESRVVSSLMATNYFPHCAERLSSGMNVCMGKLMSGPIDVTEGKMQPGPVPSANWQREPMTTHDEVTPEVENLRRQISPRTVRW